MKICFFLGGFTNNGGIGRVTSILLNRVSEYKEFQMMALCYVKKNSPDIYNISEKVAKKYFLEIYRNMTKTMFSGGIKKLREFLCENEIDVLVACGALYFPISVKACSKIKTKCICWEHSNPYGNSDHRFQNLCRKFGINRSDLNIVLTKSALDVYINKLKAENTVQIYNPIDSEIHNHMANYNSSAKKIISVGRLTYQKNFETAIETANEVLRKYPDWTWDIYGQGDLMISLQEKIDNCGLTGRMILKGQVNNLYELYNQYSIMVMTSRYEGFPMTLLEGMAYTLPLVSFDVSTGPNEIIFDGINGFLIENGNTKKMIERLTTLINDEKLRIKMSEENKHMNKIFSEEIIIKRWTDIFNSMGVIV